MASLSEISILLHSVRLILDHQAQIEELKGEQFNIFSVLRMEYKENATHSAFLSTLLNPDGSHLKGSVFLRLFLQVVQIENFIEIDTAKVKTEFSIGFVNNELKTGGRIDIFINDDSGDSISIENKIDAGDLFAQVERYCNYNTVQNKVLYLTLDGREPDKSSSGNKKPGEDFYLISYKEHISQWLELCLKEAADSPMLRESIKQYLNLIKKMTNTPDNIHEKELVNLLLNNYETAVYIKSNLQKAMFSIADQVRDIVIGKLNDLLGNEFLIEKGYPITSRYPQVWIWHKAYKKPFLFFGVEPFNGWGNGNGNLQVGIFNDSGKSNSFTNEFSADMAKHWYNEVPVKFEDVPVNFGNDAFIIEINKSTEFKEKLVDQIVTQVVDFIQLHKMHVLKHLQENQTADV